MCVYNCIFRIYTKTFISICMHIRNLNLKTSESNLYASVSYTASLTQLYPNRVQPTETCSTSPHNLRWSLPYALYLATGSPEEASELERRKTEIKQLEVAGRFDVNFEKERYMLRACIYIIIYIHRYIIHITHTHIQSDLPAGVLPNGFMQCWACQVCAMFTMLTNVLLPLGLQFLAQFHPSTSLTPYCGLRQIDGKESRAGVSLAP